MILYPAIDLKDGKCVRLRRGDMVQSTVFSDSPADQARAFTGAGCSWLHVVDLDGAVSGAAVNAEAVKAILAAVKVPVQLGGGIRDAAAIEGWLNHGVRRVVLGTAAVKDPGMVVDACRRWPGRIAVGIDARGGQVAVEGWQETTGIAAGDLARRFEDAGVVAVIYTDIDRDGMMGGPATDVTQSLADAVSVPVIASGGVSSLADLEALAAAPGIAGAVVGRALYDGGIDLGAALSVCAAYAGSAAC